MQLNEKYPEYNAFKKEETAPALFKPVWSKICEINHYMLLRSKHEKYFSHFNIIYFLTDFFLYKNHCFCDLKVFKVDSALVTSYYL